MKNLIKTIRQFKSPEAKMYWIKALKVNDTIKGRLIVHFNLMEV